MIRSHGCGRRMARNGLEAALAEAVARRRRMANAYGSVVGALGNGDRIAAKFGESRGRHDRRWADRICRGPGASQRSSCFRGAEGPVDVGLDTDGIPVAMCAECRARTEAG